MRKIFKDIKKEYRTAKKSSFAVYFILRIAVIVCMILEIVNHNIYNALLCLLTLLLFTIPSFVKKTFKIDLPSPIEITTYIFIFAAEILGEINNFYGLIPYWDILLHTLTGFIAAGFGFGLVDLLNTKSEYFNLSPLYVSIAAFCFSMTIGIIWEFFEFGVDVVLKKDMQKDTIVQTVASVKINENKENKPVIIKDILSTEIKTKDSIYVIEGGYLDIGLRDTMKDLMVNFAGALFFSIIGFLYVANREKYKLAKHFIPRKMVKEQT